MDNRLRACYDACVVERLSVDMVVGTFLTGFSFTLVSLTHMFLRPTGAARKFVYFLYIVLALLALISISMWPADPEPLWKWIPKAV